MFAVAALGDHFTGEGEVSGYLSRRVRITFESIGKSVARNVNPTSDQLLPLPSR